MMAFHFFPDCCHTQQFQSFLNGLWVFAIVQGNVVVQSIIKNPKILRLANVMKADINIVCLALAMI